MTNFKNYGILILKKREGEQKKIREFNLTEKFSTLNAFVKSLNQFKESLLDKLKKICYNKSIVKENTRKSSSQLKPPKRVERGKLWLTQQ